MPIRRRLPALALIGILPILSGVIPILDLMVGDGKPGVEAHHIPGTHGYPHDHSICIQQQANQWAPTPALSLPKASDAFKIPDCPATASRVSVQDLYRPQPRAPPEA
jgi:hypothetical protein